MIATIHTVAFAGVEVLPIEVQVAIGGQMPSFTIVGLPDKAVGNRASACAPRWRPSASRCRRSASP